MRYILPILLQTHFFLGATLALAAGLSGSRPNIVLIMTDDQGYGELSCHGNPILKTPNLDRLHRESLRFTNFHVSPTCAPTRTSLMTGRHEFYSGVTHTIYERERMAPEATTVAQILNAGGYATGIFGKWHLGDEDAFQPGRRGFDETFIHGGGGIGQTFPGSCGDAPGNGYFDPWILHQGRFEKTRGYCTDVFFGQALHWMEQQRDANRPFFAYITPNAPHDPFVSPGPEWEAPYQGRDLSTNAIRYYAMIANIDANVGRLLDRLRTLGMESNTLVIFMTDNGHSVPNVFNAGMRGAKNSPYEGGHRVPSFWRWPGRIPQGADCDRLTAHVDILPTLAGLAGVSLHSKTTPGAADRRRRRLDGRSLLPLLRSPTDRWDDRFLFTHIGRWPQGEGETAKFRGSAVRNSRFKLVNNEELYDLIADPAESTNVMAAHPRIVARLRTEFERWWAEMLPRTVANERAMGPQVNPFKDRFWTQVGGERDPLLLTRMDPRLKFAPRTGIIR